MASQCFQTRGLAREVVIHSCCPPVAPVKWLCSPGDILPSLTGLCVHRATEPSIRPRVNVSQLPAELLSPGRKVAFVGFEDLSSRAETAFPSEGAWGPLCKLSCAESRDKLRLLFCFVFLPYRGNRTQRPLDAWQSQQSQEVQVTSVSSWWLRTKAPPPP